MKRTCCNGQVEVTTGNDMYYPIYNTVMQIQHMDLTLEDAQELKVTLEQALKEVTDGKHAKP